VRHFEPSYYFSDDDNRELLASGAEDTADYHERLYDESGSGNARDSVLYLDMSTRLTEEFLRMTDSRQRLFRPGLSKRFLQPHLDGRVDENERLWPLLMFQLSHLLYVQERATEAPSVAIRSVIS
jgi:hypothetical protein